MMLMDLLQDVRGRHEHHAVWCLTPIDLHDSRATDAQWALFRVFGADDPLDGPPWFPPVEGPAPIDDEARVFRAWCPIDSGDGVVLRGTFAELIDRDELRVSGTVLFVEAVSKQFADIEERLDAQGSWEKHESRMPEIIALGPSEGIWMPYWVRD